MSAEPWIEIALLSLVAVPAVRIARKPPVLREMRAHPLGFLAVAIAIVLFAVAGYWSVGPSPWTLRIVTGMALMVGGLAFVRARPTYGRCRGLPPGSLSLAASLDAIDHEDFYAEAARRWGPVFKMSQFHQPVVCITDLALGFDLLRTDAAGLAQVPRPWAALIPGGYIEFMDGPAHERYRDLFRRALSGAVVSACKAPIATIVHRELTALTSSDAAPADPTVYVDRIAAATLLRVFFGLRPDDEATPRFARGFAAIDRGLAFRRPSRMLAADVENLATVVREAARSAGDLPSVLAEVLRTSPDALSDRTVLLNLVFMAHNARKSLANMLRWLLKLTGDHPDWAAELRREQATGGDAVATRFTHELFRLWQSEYVYRRTRRPCRVGGFRIPKGWLVRVCVREAHESGDVFPHPAAFNPARFVDRSYGRTEYAPFSDGAHACFGANLAYTLARIFLHQLTFAFDTRVVTDGPVERGNNHWVHWGPSSCLRVALTARSVAQ